jgi:hypothetical protein
MRCLKRFRFRFDECRQGRICPYHLRTACRSRDTAVAVSGCGSADLLNIKSRAAWRARLVVNLNQQRKRAMKRRFSSLNPADLAAWAMAIGTFAFLAGAGLAVGWLGKRNPPHAAPARTSASPQDSQPNPNPNPAPGA